MLVKNKKMCEIKHCEFKDLKKQMGDINLFHCVWNKKSRFVKEQEAKRVLSNLGIKTPLNKIPLLGDILF